MNRIIIIILLLLIISTLSFSNNKNKDLTTQIPKNGYILSQSCTMRSLFITMIDLDNNEMVILQYAGSGSTDPVELVNVIRTGIIVSPKKQLSFLGKDAPYDDD